MNQIGQSASQSGSANGCNDLGFRSPDPQLLKNSASRLSRLAAPAISIIVLLAVGIELSAFDLASILALLPPLRYSGLCSQPSIFRHPWPIGSFSAGFGIYRPTACSP